MANRTDHFAELKWQLDVANADTALDVADADTALVNKRLDESQGMQLLRGHLVRELDAHALKHVCFMQMVPLLWRTFGRS